MRGWTSERSIPADLRSIARLDARGLRLVDELVYVVGSSGEIFPLLHCRNLRIASRVMMQELMVGSSFIRPDSTPSHAICRVLRRSVTEAVQDVDLTRRNHSSQPDVSPAKPVG